MTDLVERAAGVHFTPQSSGQEHRPQQDDPFEPFAAADVEQSVPAAFEQRVRRHAGRVALTSGGHSLTYAALNAAANRVARAILAERGDGQEPVGVLLGHDIAAVVAMLGVLKAGKFYVPLDPMHPHARNAAIVGHAQAGLLVTDRHHHSQATELAGGKRPILAIGAIDDRLPDDDLALAGPPVPPDALALLQYTSGSTGGPKGVMHSHRNLLHLTLRATNTLRIRPDDRLSLLSSLTFSASLGSLWSALLNGASAHLFSVKAQGVERLQAWLVQREISIMYAAPAVFRQLCMAMAPGTPMPRLRMIYIGGDAMTHHDVDLYRQHFPDGCVLMHSLGLTEVNWVCRYVVDRADPLHGAVVPLGYATEGIELLALSEGGEALPAGEVGEIAIRSQYVTLGYWREPELTAQAFLPNPQGGPERIFRTGDVGYLRSDGCLVHLGRKDYQVKIRGQRVEVAEVETALLSHPGVRAAAVAAWPDSSGELRLVAYVVSAASEASRDGAQPSAGELRRWLAERLPEHMVPTAYVALDALPATATGKLDRRALPPPPDGRPFGADAYVAPRSAIQATLAALWSEVLGVDVVGAKDDFFALGGHSLHAAHLFTRVHEAYGVTLPLSTLLQCPTVEQLAGEIERRAPGTPHSSIVPIQPAGARPPFFAIHPMGGDVLLYRDLGRLLGPDQPLYGIRARGLDGNQEPHTDIEVMAADYVDQLRTMQPQGPYFLGGLSAGAVIAFEMARQLTTGGQQVALLASFDGRAVRSGYDEILWTWTWLACFAQNLAYFPAQCRHRLAELPPDDRLPAVRRAVLKNLDDLLRATLCPYGYAGLYRRLYDALGLEGRTQARLSIDDAVSPSERKTETTHALAIKRYVPGVYSGRLTVFRARAQPLFCSFDPTLGWDKLAAGGVAVKVVSGHHLSMIQPPYVATLARALRAAMDEALARGEGR